MTNNIVICCPIVGGSATAKCNGNACNCVGGKGQAMEAPTLERISGTESGNPPADADGWPTQNYDVAQAKNVDMWCPKGYFITGHLLGISNFVQDNKDAGKRVAFGCCKIGYPMICELFFVGYFSLSLSLTHSLSLSLSLSFLSSSLRVLLLAILF